MTIELARALGEEGVAAIDPSEEAVETCGARISDAEVIIACHKHVPACHGNRAEAAVASLPLLNKRGNGSL